MPATGATMFCSTVVDAVLVQPLIGSVAVTLYVEGDEIEFVDVVIPLPQLNVAPVVVDEAVNISTVFEHVNWAGVAMLTLGGVIFCDTITEAVLVHPFDGSVTVTA